jgi:hypothetical protein
MLGFAYAGEMVPGMGPHVGFKMKNRYTGQSLGDSNFSGGDAGLQYRFWNPAENGYASSDIEDDKEASSEEGKFFDNMLKCRKQCQSDKGGYSTLRDCIKACKGKGVQPPEVKKEVEIRQVPESSYVVTPSTDTPNPNKSMWIVISLLAAIILAMIIYLYWKKNSQTSPETN